MDGRAYYRRILGVKHRNDPTASTTTTAAKVMPTGTTTTDDLVPYLLAEIRCATLRARLAANDLNAIGLALKGGLITPYQALTHIEETDAFRFLGRLPEDHWGPEWAESARRYQEDRKRSAPKQPMVPAYRPKHRREYRARCQDHRVHHIRSDGSERMRGHGAPLGAMDTPP
jgi:hypothetical protein